MTVGEIATLIGALAAFCTAFSGAVVKIIYALKAPNNSKPPVTEETSEEDQK